MEQYFIDTNIIMYSAGKESEFKEGCLKILEKIAKKKIIAYIDTEVIQEILYRYHNLNLGDKGLELCWNFLDLKPKVLPITQKDIEKSLILYQKYFQKRIPPRDVIHASVIVNNSLKKIISVDKHFDEIEEVERVEIEDV